MTGEDRYRCNVCDELKGGHLGEELRCPKQNEGGQLYYYNETPAMRSLRERMEKVEKDTALLKMFGDAEQLWAQFGEDRTRIAALEEWQAGAHRALADLANRGKIKDWSLPFKLESRGSAPGSSYHACESGKCPDLCLCHCHDKKPAPAESGESAVGWETQEQVEARTLRPPAPAGEAGKARRFVLTTRWNYDTKRYEPIVADGPTLNSVAYVHVIELTPEVEAALHGAHTYCDFRDKVASIEKQARADRAAVERVERLLEDECGEDHLTWYAVNRALRGEGEK